MKEDSSCIVEPQILQQNVIQGEKKQRKMNLVRNQLKTNLLTNINQNKINKLYQSRQQQEELKNLKQKQFYQNFVIGEKIGEGTTAVVKNCKLSQDNNFLLECKDELVIKIIKYKDIEYFFEILKETIIHKSLNHSNIPKLIDSHVDNKLKSIYIVMQKAKGISLFRHLKQKKQLKEQQVYPIILQLLETFQYLHSKNIVHRDLSLDNVIYDQKLKQIQVIDFSVAKEIKNSTVKLWTQTGKVQYLAPEIFQLDYDHRIDIWAIGVIFYTLLVGDFPFSSQDDCEVQVVKNIQKKTLNYDQLNLSLPCKNLLSKMLEKDPKHRITLSQALRHPWFQEIQMQKIQRSLDFNFSPKKEQFLLQQNNNFNLNLNFSNNNINNNNNNEQVNVGQIYYNKNKIVNYNKQQHSKTIDCFQTVNTKKHKKKSQNYICTSFTTLNNMNQKDEVLIQDLQEELLEDDSSESEDSNFQQQISKIHSKKEKILLGQLKFLKKNSSKKSLEKNFINSPKPKQILKFNYEMDENEENFYENTEQLTQESEQKE